MGGQLASGDLYPGKLPPADPQLDRLVDSRDKVQYLLLEGVTPLEKIQHRARTRVLVLMIVLFALAFGTFSVAAVSAPDKTAEAEGPDPTSPVSSSAQPTTVPTADATPAPPSAEATPAAPTPEAAPGAPVPETVPDVEAVPVAPVSQTLPVGDLPGWRQVFAEDFTEGDVPIGGFPGPAYGARWSANYFDGTPDTAAQQFPKGQRKSGYYPSKVLSVHDGVLDMFLHSENGVAMSAAPSPIFGGATQRPWNSLVYGRYSVRFKADVLPGFKLAWLLWPDSKQWPQDGEIDFPEGDLGKVIYAAVHGMEGGIHTDDVFRPNVPYGSWHTATTEWRPDGIEFFLDGKSIGISTKYTPTKPMHYILQTESCSPTCPLPETSGHVEVDWVAIWAKE